MTIQRCSFLTLNVRGLKNRIKRKSIFSYLKDQNCNFYLLQETFSEPKDEATWRSEWGGDVFFSHGTNHSKGVCILVNPLVATTVENTYKDIDGRIIAIDVVCNEVSLSICNVYAPTSPQLQGKFLQILNEFWTSNLNITQLIVGGDWNVTLETIDKRGGTLWKQMAYRNSVVSMMYSLDLIDIFRKLKPNTKSYSYESKFLKVKSRIDYFLIAKNLTNLVQNVGTKTAITPDHKAIKLCLKPFKSTRGPGLLNYNKKVITGLKQPDGKITVNDHEIMSDIETFYKNLYTSNIETNSDAFDGFVHNLNFAKLSNEEKMSLEGEITREECKNILKTFQNGKSPGEDGYTAEFYKQFFSFLGQDLTDSLNAAFEFGEMSVSQRRGVITLLPKEDSDELLLSNWRPITLLNVDYKIASKTIAKRIERVLPYLIHPDQTGFMKGRYIGQNIRLINDILRQTELQKIPGILLLLDFQKAFDTLEWSFIQKTLNLLNFGDGVKRWISTFYNNSESSVMNNSFCTNNFKLSRGVRQGCPLSPYLFILAAEVLATKIRQEKSIKGINIFGNEFKISQFADDTSALCDSLSSVKNLIEIVDEFGKSSGLKLNTSKTKAIWLGSWRDREDEPFNLKWTKKPVRTLGIFVSYDENGNKERNFTLKVRNLNTSLDIWRSRYLSLFGRVLIIKSLGIPHLVYSSSMLETPSETISSVTTSLFDFIWRKKPDKIKRQVMYQDFIDGGLRVPNMEVMTKSLKLAWISRFLTVDMLSRKENWKAIPEYFLRKYGGLNFLLRCNYDKKFINQADIPVFYKQLLLYFLELKNLYGYCNGQELILFNNKEIRIENKIIFLKSWFENEILTIQDILNENGKFLPFKEFKQIYNVNCNFLNYYQVINAIPKHLLEKARNTQLNKNHFLNHGSNFQLSPSISIDLMKMKNKDYYWLFMKKSISKITATSKWERELSLNDIHWKDHFKQLKCICKENKLKEFYFNLVHRILVSKKELHLYGITDNPDCTFCGQPDSMSHTFIECPNSKQFFNEVQQYFNQVNVTSFSLSVEELLFGKSADNGQPLYKKLNYSMLFAKYYLYHQKLNQMNPDLNQFVNRLNVKYCIGKFM